jgi:hypothetical protein
MKNNLILNQKLNKLIEIYQNIFDMTLEEELKLLIEEKARN